MKFTASIVEGVSTVIVSSEAKRILEQEPEVLLP